ncbi:hypothetical protein NLJ89_g5256 [Agrocybe chaxingu]|uniref:Uncharacterized protein n=1 Tax=Agrocybe chaxingu TaxID=84603 RepID=A0A9W8K0Y8_9AGAR|nr:hypothetical protein NLJ89_g5256 [Agrocybe chaxingu]
MSHLRHAWRKIVTSPTTALPRQPLVPRITEAALKLVPTSPYQDGERRWLGDGVKLPCARTRDSLLTDGTYSGLQRQPTTNLIAG